MYRVKLIDNLSFSLTKGDKAVFLNNNDLANTVLFQLLMGEIEPDAGEINWGVTITKDYFPSDNSTYFKNDLLPKPYLK